MFCCTLIKHNNFTVGIDVICTLKKCPFDIVRGKSRNKKKINKSSLKQTIFKNSYLKNFFSLFSLLFFLLEPCRFFAVHETRICN